MNNRRCGLKTQQEQNCTMMQKPDKQDNEHSIMQNTIAKEMLREYVKENEVIFQASGYLMDVSNEVEKENKQELFAYFDDASSVKIYQKEHWFIKDEFANLDGWAKQDDVLFLLQNIGVLICVPKRHDIVNKLIAA